MMFERELLLRSHLESKHQMVFGTRKSKRIEKRDDRRIDEWLFPLPSPSQDMETVLGEFLMEIDEGDIEGMENLDINEVVEMLG